MTWISPEVWNWLLDAGALALLLVLVLAVFSAVILAGRGIRELRNGRARGERD